MLEENANNMVKEPTRPKIIKNANSSELKGINVGVMPVVRPTVAMAETHSKSVSKKGRCSILAMIMAAVHDKNKYNIKMQEAERTIPSSILRPKTSICFR